MFHCSRSLCWPNWPSNDSKKILSRIYRVDGHPCAMNFRTFWAAQGPWWAAYGPRRLAHGPQWAVHSSRWAAQCGQPTVYGGQPMAHSGQSTAHGRQPTVDSPLPTVGSPWPTVGSPQPTVDSPPKWWPDWGLPPHALLVERPFPPGPGRPSTRLSTWSPNSRLCSVWQAQLHQGQDVHSCGPAQVV